MIVVFHWSQIFSSWGTNEEDKQNKIEKITSKSLFDFGESSDPSKQIFI